MMKKNIYESYDKNDAKSNMFKDGYRVLIITNQMYLILKFTWEKELKFNYLRQYDF